MVLIYGECQKNASLAACVYSRRFPERGTPTGAIFKKLESFLRENWPSTKKPRTRTATCVESEVAQRILSANKFHPYSLSPDFI